MTQLDERAHVLEEWFRLPASRRQHPTDAVAFVYRLVQDRPDLFAPATRCEHIVTWLLPHIAAERQSDMHLDIPATAAAQELKPPVTLG